MLMLTGWKANHLLSGAGDEIWDTGSVIRSDGTGGVKANGLLSNEWSPGTCGCRHQHMHPVANIRNLQTCGAKFIRAFPSVWLISRPIVRQYRGPATPGHSCLNETGMLQIQNIDCHISEKNN